ncbi:MAG: DeoR/GlpR transcriptional regulator [Actinobacteria bacterium]|nr:DeoR/GlpR transcriptional regulator [Actinomycetota bacterium]
MDVPYKRRLEIRKLIVESKSVSVVKLAKIFNVSEITIRRDLKRLEENGFIDKVHGGAIVKGLTSEYNPVYLYDLKHFRPEKERIIKEAVKRINDQDAVIIESGTTCLEITNHLENKKSLTIFTASVPIAYELWKIALTRKDLEINICGGLIETKSNTLIGNQAVHFFKKINADIAFIGAVAVSDEKMAITTNSQMDVDVTRAIISNSKKNILVVDSSKFSKNAHFTAISLKVFNEIISDNNLGEKVVKKLKKSGIKITLV